MKANILFYKDRSAGIYKTLYSIEYPNKYYDIMEKIITKFISYNNFSSGCVLSHNYNVSYKYKYLSKDVKNISDFEIIDISNFFENINDETDPALYNISKIPQYFYVKEGYLFELNKLRLFEFKNDLNSDDPLKNDNLQEDGKVYDYFPDGIASYDELEDINEYDEDNK